MVVDDELVVASADEVVDVVQLVHGHRPELGVGHRAAHTYRGARRHILQSLVAGVGPGHHRRPLEVVLPEGDRLDLGLLLQHRHLLGADGDYVAMTAGEEGELVPGRARHHPGVELVLPLHDHPGVIHVVPHRIRSEGEANHGSRFFGSRGVTAALPLAITTASRHHQTHQCDEHRPSPLRSRSHHYLPIKLQCLPAPRGVGLGDHISDNPYFVA